MYIFPYLQRNLTLQQGCYSLSWCIPQGKKITSKTHHFSISVLQCWIFNNKFTNMLLWWLYFCMRKFSTTYNFLLLFLQTLTLLIFKLIGMLCFCFQKPFSSYNLWATLFMGEQILTLYQNTREHQFLFTYKSICLWPLTKNKYKVSIHL